MRIVITGGLGYIGSHLLIELLNKNYEVLVIDNLSNSKITIIDKIKKITNKDFSFFKADLKDLRNIKKILDNFRPDSVIHLAGLKSVEESIKNPKLYHRNNVIASNNLLNAMNAVSCRAIIFMSSATVYGSPNYFPIDEYHSAKPINPYGFSKLKVEELINTWTSSNSSNSSIIFRCFNPIGAHSSGFIGEDPISSPNNLLPIIAEVVSGKKEYVSIFGNDYETQDGTAQRDYVDIQDITNAQILAIKYINNSNKVNEIINIGSGKGTSVIKFINTFERICNKKINKKFQPRREGDISKSIASNKKAYKILNWRPKYNCEHSCKAFWHWRNSNK